MFYLSLFVTCAIIYNDKTNIPRPSRLYRVMAPRRDVAAPCAPPSRNQPPRRAVSAASPSRSPLAPSPAGTMPLPFNKQLDLKLIDLVKENPILYNTKHMKYLDFDTREVVWQKIGDSLNRPALVCKSRWINIRDMMRRKIRDRIRNPTQHSYKYKYEEELTFMLPYFKESSAQSNEEYSDFVADDSACESDIAAAFVDEATDYDNETRESKPNLSFQKRVPDPITSFNGESSFQELSPTDPLDVFLITIGSTLRKFSPYYLNQAKSKIFQVVQDYELQQIVNKDDQPPGSSEVNR